MTETPSQNQKHGKLEATLNKTLFQKSRKRANEQFIQFVPYILASKYVYTLDIAIDRRSKLAANLIWLLFPLFCFITCIYGV